MTIRNVRCLLVASAFAIIAGIEPHSASATANLPTAQTLLFDAPYLAPLSAPSRIDYHYSCKTADQDLFGASFDDDASVRLAPSAIGNGKKDATLALFSGSRARDLGPLSGLSGNPVLMMFLEHDTWEMMKHVGGNMGWYRNVIRAAFRDGAKVEPVEITWKGATVKAMKVTIQPFVNTPDAERLQLFRTKTYEFIVSDAVPGGFYDLRTAIADNREGKNGPAIDVHLTLIGIDYAKQ